MLVMVANTFAVMNPRTWTRKMSCPNARKRSRIAFPALKAIEISARIPQANASPREINWLPIYDRFSLNRHTRLSATSSGMNTPVEVTSSMTSENTWALFRAPASASRLRITNSCPAGR